MDTNPGSAPPSQQAASFSNTTIQPDTTSPSGHPDEQTVVQQGSQPINPNLNRNWYPASAFPPNALPPNATVPQQPHLHSSSTHGPASVMPSGAVVGAEVVAAAPLPPKAPRMSKTKISIDRQPGQTLLPLSRVRKIMDADRELTGVNKEAVFLVAIATEEFVKRLAISAQRQANRSGRATVQYKDMATVVKRSEEFTFLEELIPSAIPASLAFAKRSVKEKESIAAAMPSPTTSRPVTEQVRQRKSTSKSARNSAAHANANANGANTPATAAASTSADTAASSPGSQSQTNGSRVTLDGFMSGRASTSRGSTAGRHSQAHAGDRMDTS